MKTIIHSALAFRVPTGVLQLGVDWPGVFIRGDEALALASNIKVAQDAGLLTKEGPGAALIEQLSELLTSCKVEDAG